MTRPTVAAGGPVPPCSGGSSGASRTLCPRPPGKPPPPPRPSLSGLAPSRRVPGHQASPRESGVPRPEALWGAAGPGSRWGSRGGSQQLWGPWALLPLCRVALPTRREILDPGTASYTLTRHLQLLSCFLAPRGGKRPQPIRSNSAPGQQGSGARMGRGLAQGLPAGEAGLCTPTRSLGSPMPRPPRGTCACMDSALSSAVRGRGGGVPGCPLPRTEGSAHVTDASRSPKPELEAPLGPGTPVFPMPPPQPPWPGDQEVPAPRSGFSGGRPGGARPLPCAGPCAGLRFAFGNFRSTSKPTLLSGPCRENVGMGQRCPRSQPNRRAPGLRAGPPACVRW